MTDYSRGDYADLPAGTTDLENNYTAPDLTAIASNDNSTYAEQTANNEIAIHQYKKTVTGQYTNITWSGKSSLAPSESPVIMEVYNVDLTDWEELDRDDSTAADTDFNIIYNNLATADYLDSGVITWRVYQAASGGNITITIGSNTGNNFTGIQDNRLDSDETVENHGGSTAVIIGSTDGSRHDQILYRPLLDDIPSGATIVSASLFVYVTSDSGVSCTFNLYKVSDANADWVEGVHDGASGEGESCWSYKAWSATTPVNWAGSVGCSTAGTDYVNTSLGSAVHTNGATGYLEIELNASGLAVLQDWFGDASNNGLLMIGTVATNTWTVITSSEGTDGQRPYLSVTYTV